MKAREIQKRVHKLQQPQRIIVGELDPAPLLESERLGGVRQRILQRAQHQRQRCTELVTDVAEELGFRAIELLQLLRRFAQRIVSCSELAAASHDLPFEGARRIDQGLIRLGCLHERGHILHSMQDVLDRAVRIEDRDVLRTPVAGGELPVGPLDVVFLDRHGIGRASRQHAMERGPEVADSVGGGIRRVVRENIEQALPDNLLVSGLRDRKSRACCADHRETRCIGQQYEEDVRGLLEKKAVVELAAHRGTPLSCRPHSCARSR
ncbi:MAG TPA: hypothetical protein VFN79_03250 [Steroidobacteraceae bacterium]|nr:hypothetical protein [Steroidobacteraceae bacterium]